MSSLGRVSYYYTICGNWIAYCHSKNITFLWMSYKGYPNKWVLVENYCSRINPKRAPSRRVKLLTENDLDEVYCNEIR